MADLRIPSGSQPLAPAPVAARSEAVKAAQRAFFNAALNQAQATAPVRRQVAQTVAVSAPFQTVADTSKGVQPDRILRPGSLLDIKV